MNEKKIMTLEEIHQVQMDILLKIHLFCKDHGLRYSLGGGTLLGAVRHKGYIPWDDDIDIMMPRPDYDQFIATFKSGEHLSVQDCHNDDTYFYPFAKVYDSRTVVQELVLRSGVYVDVFPIDGLPDVDKMQDFSERLTHIVYKEIYYTTKTYKIRNGFKPVNYLKYLVKRSLAPSRKTALRHLDDLLLTYPFESSKNAGAVTGRYGIKEHMPIEAFMQYVELPFEGHQFMAIASWHDYLTKHYGDYMVLPPADQRISNHVNKVYWK